MFAEKPDMSAAIPRRQIIRTISLLTLAVGAVFPVIMKTGGPLCGYLADAVILAGAVLLTSPPADSSSVWALLAACLMMLSALPSYLVSDWAVAPYAPACAILCLYLWVEARLRIRDLSRLMRADAPRLFVQLLSRFAAAVTVCTLALTAVSHKGWLIMSVSALVYAGLYVCACSGHAVLLSPTEETALNNMIRGDLRRVAAVSGDEGVRMSALYSRVVACMEEKKPFLDEDFSLEGMSRMMFTNKTYLSRVINNYSGRNFKQFTNYYRIMYAVDLIKKDPRLSVMELATMSGFHSVVTFNMAFRLNMNDTPGAFSKCLPRR